MSISFSMQRGGRRIGVSLSQASIFPTSKFPGLFVLFAGITVLSLVVSSGCAVRHPSPDIDQGSEADPASSHESEQENESVDPADESESNVDSSSSGEADESESSDDVSHELEADESTWILEDSGNPEDSDEGSLGVGGSNEEPDVPVDGTREFEEGPEGDDGSVSVDSHSTEFSGDADTEESQAVRSEDESSTEGPPVSKVTTNPGDDELWPELADSDAVDATSESDEPAAVESIVDETGDAVESSDSSDGEISEAPPIDESPSIDESDIVDEHSAIEPDSEASRPESLDESFDRVEIRTPHGPIVFRLHREAAPRHVESFIRFVESGDWMSWVFYRVLSGEIVEFGVADGTSGVIDAGLSSEIVLPHRRGALGAVREPLLTNPGRRTTAQRFYVCLDAKPELDGEFTVFGTVESGWTVLEKLRAGPARLNGEVLPVDSADRPVAARRLPKRN